MCPKRLPRDRIILYSSRFSEGTAPQPGTSHRLDPRRLPAFAALVPSLESNPVSGAAQVISERQGIQGNFQIAMGHDISGYFT
jgi:hypothetical protein